MTIMETLVQRGKQPFSTSGKRKLQFRFLTILIATVTTNDTKEF
jgi:hypothetical protein